MKFSNISVQNALFQRRKRLSTKGCSEKKPRFELLKVQLPGGDSFRLRTVDVGLWHPLPETTLHWSSCEGMMKPGFFEAHYSEPTVLDALVCGSHIWSVAWFIQMKIFSWSTGVKWTKERCLLSPTGECLRFSDPILYLTWCHYIGTAIPYIPCYTISYWSHILFLPSTGCNQWAQRQLPHLSAILGRGSQVSQRFLCNKKTNLWKNIEKLQGTQVKHRST